MFTDSFFPHGFGKKSWSHESRSQRHIGGTLRRDVFDLSPASLAASQLCTDHKTDKTVADNYQQHNQYPGEKLLLDMTRLYWRVGYGSPTGRQTDLHILSGGRNIHQTRVSPQKSQRVALSTDMLSPDNVCIAHKPQSIT